jgi:hypothetical protein
LIKQLCPAKQISFKLGAAWYLVKFRKAGRATSGRRLISPLNLPQIPSNSPPNQHHTLRKHINQSTKGPPHTAEGLC